MNPSQYVVIVSGADTATLEAAINKTLSNLTDQQSVQNMYYFNDSADFHCSIWIVDYNPKP